LSAALETQRTRASVWQLLLQAVTSWTWAHTGLTFFMGAFALFNLGSALEWGLDFPWARSYAYNVVQFGLPIVLTVRMADAARDQGAHAGWAYGGALVFTVTAGVWLFGPALFLVLGGEPQWSFANDLGLYANVLLPYGMAVIAYAYWRDAQQQRERLHRSAIDREHRIRATQGARLLALQTRVEPELLAQAVARVQQLIDVSPEAAEAELERLIGLLRAMQPHARAQASYLARELELITHYANVARIDGLTAPRWRTAVAEPAPFAKLAPMVMLPLAKALAAANDEVLWRLDASVEGGMLHVRLQASAPVQPGAPFEDTLSQARARLLDVHGQTSDLQWNAAERQLMLRAPFEDDPLARKAQNP
jgi:hypothetical protein